MSVNEESRWALPSQPGLNVRRFLSNIPWKIPDPPPADRNLPLAFNPWDGRVF